MNFEAISAPHARPAATWADWRWMVAALPGALLATWLLVQGLVRGPTLDASVFAYVTEVIRVGGMPYRDVFDHKPPGMYIAEAVVGIAIPALDFWSRAWAVTLASTLGTVVLLARWLSPRWSLGAALSLAVAAPILGGHFWAQGGGYTESLAILPATGGFLAAARGPSTSLRRSFLVGILVGAAVAISLQLAPAVLAVLVVLIVRRTGRRSAGAFVLGCLAVGAGLAAWLMSGNALAPAYEQVVAYNQAYLAEVTFLQPWVSLQVAALTALISLPLLTAVLVRALGLIRARRIAGIEAAAITWLLAWIAMVGAQRQMFGHYAIAIVPPAVVLAAPVLDCFRSWLRGRAMPIGVATLSLSIALGAAVLVSIEPGGQRRPVTYAASAAVDELTAPDARILVWGNEPLVYLRSGRRASSAFVYQLPLTNDRYVTQHLVASLRRDWERQQPAVIIDASSHPSGVGSHPLLGPWDIAGPPVPDLLDPLRDFVRDNYRLETIAHGWPIYVPN